MLVGFDIVAPDAASGQPLLWPGGITAGSAEQLNMTDVRVVVRSQEVFNKYLEYFTSQYVILWTVSLTHIAGVTSLIHAAVGLCPLVWKLTRLQLGASVLLRPRLHACLASATGCCMNSVCSCL